MSSKEPFGYKITEDGHKEVIPEQLEALAKAAYYIDQGCSMQSARDWLVNKTGRQISVPGLLKAIRYNKNDRGKTPYWETAKKSSQASNQD